MSLGRLFQVLFALTLAVFSAAITLLFVMPVAFDMIVAALRLFVDLIAYSDRPDLVIGEALKLVAYHLMLMVVAPVVVIGLIGEIAKWRSALWYVAATGVITALIPLLLRPQARIPTGEELHISAFIGLIGIVAGLVYWLIAGRSARAEHKAPPTTRTPSP